MIESNLRKLLVEAPLLQSTEQLMIRAAYNTLAGHDRIGFEDFNIFAEVLEQNVVPVAFRNEVLPILLDGARTGHYLDAAADARDRALVRTVLDYDWKDTDVVEALDPPSLFPETILDPKYPPVTSDHGFIPARAGDATRAVSDTERAAIYAVRVARPVFTDAELAPIRDALPGSMLAFEDAVAKAAALGSSDYAEPDNSQAGIERDSIVRMLEREGLRAAADLVRSCAHHVEQP